MEYIPETLQRGCVRVYACMDAFINKCSDILVESDVYILAHKCMHSVCMEAGLNSAQTTYLYHFDSNLKAVKKSLMCNEFHI